MNRNYNILYGALLLLVSEACFQSCQQDDLRELRPNMENLVAEGRYLTARSEDASALASDTEDPTLFDIGTPYRLLAFTKPYYASDAENLNNTDNHPRFNKVGWEGEMAGGLRFININSEPDKWFGFSALLGETGGDDGLVSLDLYGFTYGEKVGRYPSDYIELDDIEGEETPAPGTLSSISHTESVAENGELKDLMRGVLLNQNIETAGKSKDGAVGTANSYTQSVMTFRHCFSKLRFQISQQGDDDNKDADGTPALTFDNLYVESIQVTGTYGSGTVYLQNGKINLNDPCDRSLSFKNGYDGKVAVKNSDVGEMILFPSDGNSLLDMPDGYSVGLNITVKSTVEKDIKNMVVNTGGSATSVTSETIDGTTWYKGTIVKNNIVDYYSTAETDKEVYLHFRQNSSYVLIINFQKDAVRIVTVIPQIEEWLPGEGTADDPWDYQAMGQPQMFDNVIWSDRNIGAGHYDPQGDNFEKTMGYFYQAGRNIPYYPLKFHDYVDKGKLPTIEDIEKVQNLGDYDTRWKNDNFRFFPVVDDGILTMGDHYWWVINGKNKPQMYIPEGQPTDAYFDFMGNKDLGDYDMEWNKEPANQPVSGSWVIPTSAQYMSIFPSTPHAGNITFRTGGYNNDPMSWSSGLDKGISGTKTLRVTVPYYKHGSTDTDKPTDRSPKYQQAWQTLHNKRDPGTTHTNLYTIAGPDDNVKYEPDGDPEDGYASIYVISKERENVDIVSLTGKSRDNMYIKEWGTIYAIKRVYTAGAYRMRWRALVAYEGAYNPGIYIEISRYRCSPDDTFDEKTYKDYDWDHPAARLYFPVSGLGDHPGQYINFGTECQYATSDPISEKGLTSAVQIKITGDNASNAYIAIVKGYIDRHFGMQIRPVGGGK